MEQDRVIHTARQIVPVSQVPALDAYLSKEQYTKIEFDRLQVSSIYDTNQVEVVRVGYGCGNKMCQNVLVQVKDNETLSLELPESIYMDSLLLQSQYDTRALIQYGYDEGNVNRSGIVGIDLDTFQILKITDEDIEKLMGQIPIQEKTWIDAQTIELMIADVPDGSFEALKVWYDILNKEPSKAPTRKVIVTFTT
ncbi:hypothetical protein [Paenibacillus segetis]|nr:hypothetical protein [Paenibacillus segetis]